jgi:hypothetical protein
MAHTPQEKATTASHIRRYERYAAAALKERRASIDGLCGSANGAPATFTKRHQDATVSPFDADGNPKAIKAKRPDKRVKLFGAGKLNRLILDALRRAPGPLSTQGVIDAVVADVGFGPDAAAGIRSRVRSNLLYLSKVRGLVVKEGERETATWRLAHL